MDIYILNELLASSGIEVLEVTGNAKASEHYARTVFTQEDGFKWETVVPYYNRRSGLFLESEKDIADYIISLKPYFKSDAMSAWREKEKRKWESKGGDVTKEFFFVLLSFKGEINFPPNNNPQRRIQDIKDQGYTIGSIREGRFMRRYLLPIPINVQMGYETFTEQFKQRVIRLFGGINAYEAKATAKGSLIPDHKFSEIRWDVETKGENPMNMTDEEIIAKFQLLDNQRNQQKREVCRNCFQTSQRGQLFGIDFYSIGGPVWDDTIPAIGKVAEKGCIGCPWYDIEAWRRAINEKLNNR